MSVQVKRRREAATFLSGFIGAPAELIVDTTNNRVQVHDGATAGGWPAAKLAEVVTNTRAAVADAAYTARTTDRTIAYATLTATRIVSLPAAATYPTGVRLLVVDETGNCSSGTTITLSPNGADTINGGASYVLKTPNAFVALESNGIGRWTVIDQSTAPVSALTNIGLLAFAARSVNLNATGDTPIAISLPAGVNRYRVNSVQVLNSQGALPTAARLGVFTASGQGGVAIASEQSIAALTSQANDAAGNLFSLTVNNNATACYVETTLYANVGTAQGAVATVDIVIILFPL